MADIKSDIEYYYQQLLYEFWTTSGIANFGPIGMKLLYEKIDWDPTAENPDPTLHIGSGAPEYPIEKNRKAAWRMSVIKEAGEVGGWLSQWLGDAWICLIFSRWEEYYRPHFAQLHGVDKGKVQSHVMGDIRHLRNDVVHHNGIASKENAGRCQLLTRFEPGTRISISSDDVKMLMQNLEIRILE